MTYDIPVVAELGQKYIFRNTLSGEYFLLILIFKMGIGNTIKHF